MGAQNRLQCGSVRTRRSTQLGYDTTATDDREGLIAVLHCIQEVGEVAGSLGGGNL